MPTKVPWNKVIWSFLTLFEVGAVFFAEDAEFYRLIMTPEMNFIHASTEKSAALVLKVHFLAILYGPIISPNAPPRRKTKRVFRSGEYPVEPAQNVFGRFLRSDKTWRLAGHFIHGDFIRYDCLEPRSSGRAVVAMTICLTIVKRPLRRSCDDEWLGFEVTRSRWVPTFRSKHLHFSFCGLSWMAGVVSEGPNFWEMINGTATPSFFPSKKKKGN